LARSQRERSGRCAGCLTEGWLLRRQLRRRDSMDSAVQTGGLRYEIAEARAFSLAAGSLTRAMKIIAAMTKGLKLASR
jgi:hypothetical protein